MSWSFQGVGKPGAVKRAIDIAIHGYSDRSREEFEHAAPHLKGLLDAADGNAAVCVNASGHAMVSNGQKTSANITVEIRQLGAFCE